MSSGAPVDILLVVLVALLFLGAAFSDHRRKLRELDDELRTHR